MSETATRARRSHSTSPIWQACSKLRSARSTRSRAHAASGRGRIGFDRNDARGYSEARRVVKRRRRRHVSGAVEKAILAGGCFWGMQDLIRKRPGVLTTRVGYTGGDVPNATYRNHGTHAEAIEIVFDP